MDVSPIKQRDVTAPELTATEKRKYTINTNQSTDRLEGKKAKKRKRQKQNILVDPRAKKVKEEDVEPKWKAELQLATDKMDSRSEEVKTRLQHETTGFVPSLQPPERDGPGLAWPWSTVCHFQRLT